MTSTEFVQWLEFIELDYEMLHREDLFTAKLIAEVRRGWVAKPKDIDENTFVKLHIVRDKPQSSPEDKLKLIEQIKKMHRAMFGIKDG